jgi:hypothetical protein
VNTVVRNEFVNNAAEMEFASTGGKKKDAKNVAVQKYANTDVTKEFVNNVVEQEFVNMDAKNKFAKYVVVQVFVSTI